MDRRQLKSRRAIFGAFSRLLARKHFNSITVQEIIDEADVGRSTFYAHFETRDDLLRQMCSEIFGHIFAEVQSREKTHDFSHSPATLQNRLTHLLYHFLEKKEDITSLLSGESSDLFMQFFREQLKKTFDGAGAAFPGHVPADYADTFYVASFAEMIRLWVKKGMTTAPEVLARYYFELAGGVFSEKRRAPQGERSDVTKA